MGAFTKQELIAASRKAEAEGDSARAKRLAEMSMQADSPTDKLRDPNTVMGRVFQAIDDPTAVAMDAFTRGFGHTEQAATDVRAARERLPAAEELPADIAGGVMGSPYRVAGAGWGAVAGGAEGIANAYGHESNWVPSRDDLAHMAVEGGKGAVLGTIGAKAGEKIGNWWAGKKAPAPEFPTDADLETGAYNAIGTNDPRANELADRTQRLDAARKAQATGDPEAYKTLTPANPLEASTLAAVQRGASRIPDYLKTGGRVLSGRGGSAMTAIPANILNAKTGGFTGGAGLTAEAVGNFFSKPPSVNPKLAEAYATAIRNGGDLKDPKLIEMARTLLSQAGVGAGKSPVTGGPR
jgi:hypothetical protein